MQGPELTNGHSSDQQFAERGRLWLVSLPCGSAHLPSQSCKGWFAQIDEWRPVTGCVWVASVCWYGLMLLWADCTAHDWKRMQKQDKLSAETTQLFARFCCCEVSEWVQSDKTRLIIIQETHLLRQVQHAFGSDLAIAMKLGTVQACWIKFACLFIMWLCYLIKKQVREGTGAPDDKTRGLYELRRSCTARALSLARLEWWLPHINRLWSVVPLPVSCQSRHSQVVGHLPAAKAACRPSRLHR